LPFPPRCSFSSPCDPTGLWGAGQPVFRGGGRHRALHVPARFRGALWHRGCSRGFPLTTGAHLGEAGSSCPSPRVPGEACSRHQRAVSWSPTAGLASCGWRDTAGRGGGVWTDPSTRQGPAVGPFPVSPREAGSGRTPLQLTPWGVHASSSLCTTEAPRPRRLRGAGGRSHSSRSLLPQAQASEARPSALGRRQSCKLPSPYVWSGPFSDCGGELGRAPGARLHL